jgi:hypothetical protein
MSLYTVKHSFLLFLGLFGQAGTEVVLEQGIPFRSSGPTHSTSPPNNKPKPGSLITVPVRALKILF